MLRKIADQAAFCLEQAREADRRAAMAPPETKQGWEQIANRWRYIASRFAGLAPSTRLH